MTISQFPALENAPIDLLSVRTEAQHELVEALDSLQGKKTLVLDPKISGPLALIAQTTLIKEHGVEHLCHLSADTPQYDCKNVIFLVRPRVNLMKMVAAHIQRDIRQPLSPKQYALFFMPRRSVVCEKVLEEEGVRGLIKIHEYNLTMIPFDEDVISLEHGLAFRECHVEGDTSSMWYLASAINKLQSHFGIIPNVKGKGKAAAQVFDILTRMQREQSLNTISTERPRIDTMILFDRQVDMVTPMCSQLTYEGLIDEFLHINNGTVELDSSLMETGNNPKVKAKVYLNSSDKLFRDLRDLNFAVVGQILREKAKAIQEDYTSTKSTEMSVTDLKAFVKKIYNLPDMTRHIDIARYLSTLTSNPSFSSRLSIEQTVVEGSSYATVYEYIEDMICQQQPLVSVLRLLVLLSVTNNGLPKKDFDYFRRELIHSYGFEHLISLTNLEKAGLLKKQEGKNTWEAIKRGLKLTVDDVSDLNPTDISYVFSGYAPLSIRLVEHALKGGWRSIEDVLKLIPGPTFERKQQQRMDNPNRSQSVVADDGRRTLVLVVFIGGVTFAEISALRFLSSQESVKYDFVVATTKLVNGESMLQPLLESLS